MSLTIQPKATSERTQTLLKVWGHLQHELIYIMWALMDVALLTPFVLAIMGWTRYWPPGVVLLLILFIMLFSFNLTRLLSGLHLPPKRQQVITAVVLLGTILIFLRTMFHTPDSLIDFGWIAEFFASLNSRGDVLWVQDVILLFIIFLAWVRGIQLSTREYSVNRLGLRLRVGGLILAPFIIWMSSLRLLYSITPFILLFLFAGLTAVSLIRAEELEQDQSGNSVTLSPRWLTAVLLSALFIIGTAVILTMIISGNTAEEVSFFFAPAIQSLGILATVTIATIIYLLLPLFYLLDVFVNLLTSFINGALNSLTIFAKIISKLQRYNRIEIDFEPEFIPFTNQSFNSIIEQVDGVGVDVSRNWQIIIILLVIALVLLISLMIGRIYRTTITVARKSKWADDLDSESENEGFANRLLRQLGFWQDWRTALSIRRIYRKMNHAAAASGYPRLEAETPYEYLRTLALAWPENKQETEQITRAYVRVRYGELPETKEELEALHRAWKQLEQTKPTDASSQQAIQPTLNKRK